jgi:hypothetical protein
MRQLVLKFGDTLLSFLQIHVVSWYLLVEERNFAFDSLELPAGARKAGHAGTNPAQKKCQNDQNI